MNSEVQFSQLYGFIAASKPKSFFYSHRATEPEYLWEWCINWEPPLFLSQGHEPITATGGIAGESESMLTQYSSLLVTLL